ncbi:MAG TPA: transglycosylase domain-containing protein [Candidatus Dormibacteraeota bacterium]|jgi:membrane peptidoglycan carboxypeptidase|nr:transglycosylase domain-containing protein [Candidatus Dormibacteraeota bacterium]
MSRDIPETIKTKGGHRPRARIHANWSPIGQRLRRNAILRIVGVVLALFLVVGLAADAYAQSFFDSLPSIQGLDSAVFSGDTVITDKRGVILADVGDQGNHRLAVKLKDINPMVIKATVAIEDKGFYSNPGFDISAIVRATYDNLKAGHIVSGASTITQQLAKQQFLTPDQSITRKLKELALAYELSQSYTKDQIMELYLNKSFYGSQSYGIEAAAEGYFHIHASQLDLAQSAVLAGLPQAPTEWNPVLHPDAAKLRQTEVLNAMVRSGFITQSDMDTALAEKLVYHAPINSFKAPHFVDFVLQELRQLGFQPGVQQLYVKTTLDYKMQLKGEAVVRANLAANEWRDTSGQLSSGLIAEDPKTGEILVMVGSPNYNAKAGQINYTTIPRNMGSSMKPYTYGAVINARAATVDTPVYDGPSPLVYKDAYSTTLFYNYDHRTHGVLPLKKAMGNSLNIAAVKVELSIGVPAVLTYMRNLGVLPRYIPPKGGYQTNAPPPVYGPSLTLGGYPITLLEHVNGIATYADMGVYHTPEAILTVTDSHGQVLYATHPNQRARAALDPGVAYIMGQIMSDDQNRCMIFGCNSALHWSNRQVAAKTGTTDNFKDAVTVAFTPDIAAAIWVGDILNNNYTMVQGSDGVFVASPGMHTFIDQALAGVAGNRWFTKPADVVGGPGNSWFLSDTRSIAKLPGDSGPKPTPKPVPFVVPPDPGTGPVVANPPASPNPTPSPTSGCIPPPGCKP